MVKRPELIYVPLDVASECTDTFWTPEELLQADNAAAEIAVFDEYKRVRKVKVGISITEVKGK